MAREIPEPLRPYERQQGGYWEYGHGEDVYGNGRVWVSAAEHEERMRVARGDNQEER